MRPNRCTALAPCRSPIQMTRSSPATRLDSRAASSTNCAVWKSCSRQTGSYSSCSISVRSARSGPTADRCGRANAAVLGHRRRAADCRRGFTAHTLRAQPEGMADTGVNTAFDITITIKHNQSDRNAFGTSLRRAPTAERRPCGLHRARLRPRGIDVPNVSLIILVIEIVICSATGPCRCHRPRSKNQFP